MTDVAMETRVFNEPPQGSEKKWGFKTERLKDAPPITAKDLPKTIPDGNDTLTDYGGIAQLTQRYIDYLGTKKLHIPGLIPGFREELEQKHANNHSVDKETYLTRLNELYEFPIGSEDRYSIPKCYNFTDTKLSDKQLTEIGDALGEINIRSGGKILNFLRSIVIIPDDHPLMDNSFVNPEHGKGGGRIFPGYPFIILNESKINNKKKQKKDRTPTMDDQQDLVVNESLTSAVLHEAVHLWQHAEPEAAKRLEATVLTSGETFPSRHGGQKTKSKGEERYLEILPEAIVALSSPETEHLVGPTTRQAVTEFQRDSFLQENDGGTVARPTYVRCRQIDLQTLVENAQQIAKQGWRRPLAFISRSLAAMRKP